MSGFTVVYALEALPDTYSKSIMLVGPTPREQSVASWRPEAIHLLEEAGYDGVVMVPEDRSGKFHGDYIGQIDWEDECLNKADCILVWVPRDMKTLPGLTTNTEFGRWENSGKVVYGAPPAAEKNRYLKHYADKLDVPSAESLKDTVALAIEMVGDGAMRTAGEREVPLHIWRTASFQQWYGAQKAAGNRLDHARQEWTFRVGPQRKIVFLWALHVDVYIASEDRHKTNEVVIARPDISTIVMYRNDGRDFGDTNIVLIREFRSPASTTDGCVHEVPGGSSFKPGGDPLQLAAEEAHEETGLLIEPSRFKQRLVRQLVSTLSAHKAHLFSVELTREEMDYLRSQSGVAHGVVEDSERTYVEVTTLDRISNNPDIDWAMYGMIMKAVVG